MKVFIVEDEHLIIKYIRGLIDWEAMGMEVAGDARDGETALELIPSVCPDIILMDINLPMLNGLETSRRIKDMLPHVKIILLTGYREFRYAQEAIRLGVYRYLLKPIDPEELRNTLESAAAEIRNERNVRRIVHEAAYTEQEAAKIRFLNQWLAGDGAASDEAWIRGRLDAYRIRLPHDRLIVSLLVIDDARRRFAEEKEREWRAFMARNAAQEALERQCPTVVFPGPDGMIAVISGSGDVRAVAAGGEAVRRFLELRADFTVTMAVGRPCVGYRNIRQSYQDALRTLKHRFTLGINRILVAGPEPEHCGDDPHHPDERQKDEWMMDLRLGRFDKLEADIRRCFGRFRACRVTKEEAVFFAVEMMGLMQVFCRESNVTDNRSFPGKEEFMDMLQDMETIEEMEDGLLHLLDGVRQRWEETGKSSAARIADNARELIHRHYADPDLSLNRIAEQLHVSPFYLSKVFRKELNLSFSGYLGEYRLMMAKRMLDESPSLPLSQVAERTGFHDPYYFSKCFKKRFGLTPSRYAERKRT